MDVDIWDASVREALTEGDGPRLTTLFEQAVEHWGRDSASRHWWRVLSAYDAEAHTG